EQKDQILKVYPMAKFDTATTRSIELLPAEVKNKMFSLVVKNKSLDVVEEFLKEVKEFFNITVHFPNMGKVKLF
ncbi:unnamed protein product, partial [marine sediment metagenome]